MTKTIKVYKEDDNDKIIVKFQNQNLRNDFIKEFNKDNI